MIRAATVLLLAAIAVQAACLPVAGSHIFGRDLAAAEPRFATLPATLEVGFPPAPGTQRLFTVAELTRIAQTNKLSFIPTANVCFELAMHLLTADAALAVLRKVLPPGAEIKIVEVQQTTVPEGPVEFPLSGLEPVQPDPSHSNNDARLWRGFVRYAGSRREPVWARVTISGETQSAPVSRRALNPETAADVRRGDSVHVEVDCGLARLALDAIAVAGGHTGEMVELRNPETGKTFHARLLTPVTAKIVLAPGQTL